MVNRSGDHVSTRRMRQMTVRTRVLVAVSFLSLLALLLAGFVAYALERQRIDNSIDDLLTQRHAAVEALIGRATDPTTGARITTTRAMLRASMQLIQAGPTEGSVALIGDRVVWTAPVGVVLRPENDRELLAAVRDTDPGQVLAETVNTRQATYRVIVVPVGMAGDTEIGKFVWVVNASAQHAELQRSYQTYVLVGLLALVVVWLVAWLLIGQLLEPIKLLRETAQEITETDLSRRIPVRGNDDLAQLTLTVNAMLGRLENTFAAQRELYDDVGHELKTPLTVLRGHMEVMNVDDPVDVATTRRRVISEVDRMARLVEDLITLAKSERPDFVRLQPVDIAALTDEVLAKATALGPRRWTLEDLADVRVLADPQRISQALLELARNAVKFSEPGSTIAMGSAADETSVRMWVRDQGVGIPEAEQMRVRERFVRARNRSIEGSGLGLAIVSSIAAAHGGQLHISSTPGEGSTISLVLPRNNPEGELPDAVVPELQEEVL